MHSLSLLLLYFNLPLFFSRFGKRASEPVYFDTVDVNEVRLLLNPHPTGTPDFPQPVGGGVCVFF